jgi:hypothetical protein
MFSVLLLYYCNGYIWKNGFDSLIHLLNKCKCLNIPIILETNGSDIFTLASLSEMCFFCNSSCEENFDCCR